MRVHIKMFMGAVVNILSEKKVLPLLIEKMERNEACGTPENGDYAYFFSARFLFSTLIDASLL